MTGYETYWDKPYLGLFLWGFVVVMVVVYLFDNDSQK